MLVIEQFSFYKLKHFELKDVWMNNQYVHCKLIKNQCISDLTLYDNSSVIIRILRRFQRYFRRKKYIDKIFKES